MVVVVGGGVRRRERGSEGARERASERARCKNGDVDVLGLGFGEEAGRSCACSRSSVGYGVESR